MWTRRKVIAGSVLGLGSLLGAGVWSMKARSVAQRNASVRVPPLPAIATSPSSPHLNPLTFLRQFNHGTLKHEQGRTIREFTLTAESTPIQLNSSTTFISWNLNGQVPAPTLRAKANEWIRIIFHNADGHSHSLHFHGIHPADMDGIQPVRHDQTTLYEFKAEPFGVHPYHCHIAPVTRHISKGLYGLLIIDPPQERPKADEMVLVMGGYDLNNDEQNELYAFNGIPNIYRNYPIPIFQHQLVRLYLLNMIEYDPAITFHIHANMFEVYRTGMGTAPTETSDVITMGTAERHILEFAYPFPGQYMFHPHQDAIAEHGCMGLFDVIPA
jgi:manganese oxidase